MSEVQEFRDRCAKAMGFVEKSWGNAGVHWHDPAINRAMTGWRPDEDYNQAMMRRDRCDRIRFLQAMVGVDAMRGDGTFSMGDLISVGHATCRQIAKAALTVLEEE